MPGDSRNEHREPALNVAPDGAATHVPYLFAALQSGGHPYRMFSCQTTLNCSAAKYRSCEPQGAIEGPIRLPPNCLLFLLNDLAFPSISYKSLQFQSALFSIPTAPTNPVYFL